MTLKPHAAAVLQQRFAVLGHQIGADVVVGHIKNGVGEIGEFVGHVAQGGDAEHIAQQDAQQVAAAEACEVDGGSLLVQEADQPVAVVVHGERAVEGSGVGHMSAGAPDRAPRTRRETGCRRIP